MSAVTDNQAVTLLPLTRSQLMIWTGQRLQSTEPLYNMALSFRIQGELDAKLFQQAFGALVARCDALRTSFVTINGVPRQRIHEHYQYQIDQVDLSSSADVEAALTEWQSRRVQKLFDLSNCLFDSVLIKLHAAEFVWFFNQHHLTTDAWSTSLIYEHMQAFYQLAGTGQLEAAQYLPDYQQYVEFEASQRDTKWMRRAQEYWQKQLTTPVSPSRFYRPTPRDRGGRTQRIACDFGAARSSRLKAMAERGEFRAMTDDLSRFQLFATVLFAWLHRISGHEQLSIGTPCHNRGTSQHKNTVGLFIEIYPLRVDIEPHDTFFSLYQKVALQTRRFLMNAPPGASGFEHNRAYDVLINYITASFGEFAGLPMQSDWVHADHGDRNHLVRMQVEDFDHLDYMRVFFDLNTDVFAVEERHSPGEQFIRLMDAMLDAPQTAINTVDLLTDAQRAELQTGWAAEQPDAVPQQTILDYFDQQVARTPNAIAITERLAAYTSKGNDVDTDLVLTYANLQECVNTLADLLQQRGVQPDFQVGLMVARSADAVICLLAVMRCGASYVPVDPAYPPERREYLLDNAKVKLVIADHRTPGPFPDGIPVLMLNDLQHEVVERTDVSGYCQLDSTAYVIYTSGSTGKPKGVKVSHRNLANYIHWAATEYTGGKKLSWPLFTSLSFDLTVTSVFVPLATGGQIVIYPDPESEHEILIRRVIADNLIDVAKLTPAHLSLMQAMDLSFSRVRALIIGGEDFKTELARSISAYFGGNVVLYNEYGPTEATVACMIHRYQPLLDTDASVPIGRAIDNATVYVLNSALQLQPPGVIGELYIGGAGVAQGYLHRPDLTSERFVDNPFIPGEKMYRSGDLARSNSNGTLTCLGRSDEQLKINAIRVEPGEIEAAILKHPDITECTVQLQIKEHQGDNTDEAYCVSCGLSGIHPAAQLDDSNTCIICHAYDAEREQALSYFGTMQDLHKIADEIKTTVNASTLDAPNCMMLLSGGKDSTYALCQIVDLGLRPLVFTLDNGFISDGAKANMRRVTEHLDLELIVGSTDAMNEIFRDSLNRFSNVCNGCFKTIYTLSLKIAKERGIKHIFTGLSRGQIFETRVADLFRQRVFEPGRIDALIIEARKAYHRADDAVNQQLDTSHLQNPAIFSDIKYVDYFRYTDVSLAEMLVYLRDRAPWVRPADTGRSTNCLINEAGIYVHKKERGFHNYSLPYSWDVRLGHKERDAAREELDDNINVDNVNRILEKINYTPRVITAPAASRQQLTAYYVAAAALDTAELRAQLRERLPEDLVPHFFVHLDTLPLTSNGKIDRAALPHPDMTRPELGRDYVAPEGHMAVMLSKIWARVFGIDRVGVHDNFFELGGDSIINIQIVALASKEGLMLSPQQVFEYPTIAELKDVVGTARHLASEQGSVSGKVALTPIQHRYFGQTLNDYHRYAQVVLLDVTAPLDVLALEEALRLLINHHDALRSCFVYNDGHWQQEICTTLTEAVSIETRQMAFTHGGVELPESDHLSQHINSLLARLDIHQPAPLQVAVLEGGRQHPQQLLLCIHHLVIDAVSWWILTEDLEQAYMAIVNGQAPSLPLKTTSIKHWSEALRAYARSDQATSTLPLWNGQQSARAQATPLPLDSQTGDGNTVATTAVESITLSLELTQALMTVVASNWRTQPHDLMLVALVKTLQQWSAATTIGIDIEGHGREAISDELDLLRTVGWFTSVFPVSFGASIATAESSEELAQGLREVRDTLRSIPFGGIAHGAMRYLDADSDAQKDLKELPASPVLFNYLGKWRQQTSPNAMFAFARPLMARLGTDGMRAYQHEINAVVFEGVLQIDWSYSTNLHQAETIRLLITEFARQLRKLINYCRAHTDTKRSTADFPTAALNQNDLDDIMAEFGEL